MNSISNELVLVRCSRCVLEGMQTWLRLENAYPATFLISILNPQIGELRATSEKIYLCKEHAWQYIPIDQKEESNNLLN